MTRRRGSIDKGAVSLLLSTAVLAACSQGDPGYSVAIRNDSDARLVVRVSGPDGGNDPQAWLVPPHAAGRVLMTLGTPGEAPPITYEIVDEASCAVVGLQRVDFTLAPDPGYSESIVVVGADMRLRVETRSSGDPNIVADLEAATSCLAA